MDESGGVGRSPSGRGQAIGVTSLAIGLADLDAGAVDGEVRVRVAAPVLPSGK